MQSSVQSLPKKINWHFGPKPGRLARDPPPPEGAAPATPTPQGVVFQVQRSLNPRGWSVSISGIRSIAEAASAHIPQGRDRLGHRDGQPSGSARDANHKTKNRNLSVAVGRCNKMGREGDGDATVRCQRTAAEDPRASRTPPLPNHHLPNYSLWKRHPPPKRGSAG